MCQTGRQDIFILFLTVPDAVWDIREIVKPKFPKRCILCSNYYTQRLVLGKKKERNTRYSEFISVVENVTV